MNKFSAGDWVICTSKGDFAGEIAPYYGQLCKVVKVTREFVYVLMPYYKGPIDVDSWEHNYEGGGGFYADAFRLATPLEKELV